MVEELLDEVTGLGPLEPLLRDNSISDILVNAYGTVYIERFGKLELTGVRFRDNGHLTQIINRIVSRVGRRVDETSPMVDARLQDGSRVNAIIPPLAIDGPTLSIRRFGGSPLRIQDLLRIGSVTPDMVAFLGACVKAKLNMLVSGGTGTGKTTMLNALSSFIPETSASSPSRTRPSSSSSSGTWCAWRPDRPTSRARARSSPATWSATASVCGPTASSSARFAAPRCWTCSRP